ncbi:hypothetical protein LTR56_019910 [Elasticomyces elasticus]|nr:hypothetical protein LTR56_019910 [Elasticomyces elasticus]KAK3643403.1 hypothetical protein LTR22_015706 [Elasticomyces elasticus]KAK5755456.1 hypothetical protein LTS12_014441 [Elasticomyces elasticus]
MSKWLIDIILAASSMCVTCASALYITTTYSQLEPDFHISELAATVGLNTLVLGIAVGPMILSPLSEFYGRRMVYLSASC